MNRCEVRVLQRKELERRLKEQRRSLVDSRLWLGANLRCLWWKRVALDSDKEGLVQKKGFWRKKGGLLRIARKGLCKWKAFGLWKREIFEDRKERLVQKENFCA